MLFIAIAILIRSSAARKRQESKFACSNSIYGSRQINMPVFGKNMIAYFLTMFKTFSSVYLFCGMTVKGRFIWPRLIAKFVGPRATMRFIATQFTTQMFIERSANSILQSNRPDGELHPGLTACRKLVLHHIAISSTYCVLHLCLILRFYGKGICSDNFNVYLKPYYSANNTIKYILKP